MKIKYQILNENAKEPKQGSEKAGGWDITAAEIIHERPDYVRVKTGLAMQPEEGYKITIVPRSSITKSNWILQNSPALGDEDYLGEYELRFKAIPQNIAHSTTYIQIDIYDLTYEEFPYSVGDRVAQMYAEEVIPLEFERVEKLEATVRGEGGFGSTGNR